MKKRVITLILAILTCFSSIFGFVGCIKDKEFTVTFVANREGAVLADRFDESVLKQTVSHYSQLIIPVFVCENAYHYAWNKPIRDVNRDITLKATWRDNDFTVIFSPGAEDAVLVSGQEKCEANSTMSIKFPKYSRPGYSQDETWGGIDLQTINIPSDSVNPTINFTATWIPNTYGVSFVDEDGVTKLFDKKGVKYNMAIGELPVPEKEGKKFAGWKIKGSSTVLSAEKIYNYLNDIVLQAVWVDEEGQYLISYYNVEDVNNPITYTEEDRIKLNNPTKVGYKFVGWSGTGLDGIVEEVTIEKGTIGNLEFTANWELRTYGLTLNHGTGKTSQITVTYSEKVGELPVPENEGFYFLGWYTQNGMEVTADTIWLIDDSSIYIEAKYLRIYTIKYVLECYTNTKRVVSKFDNETLVTNKFGLVKSQDEENVWYLSNVMEGTVIKEDHIYAPTPINSSDYYFSAWRYYYGDNRRVTVKGGTLINEKTFPNSYESGVITLVAHCFSYWTPFY